MYRDGGKAGGQESPHEPTRGSAIVGNHSMSCTSIPSAVEWGNAMTILTSTNLVPCHFQVHHPLGNPITRDQGRRSLLKGLLWERSPPPHTPGSGKLGNAQLKTASHALLFPARPPGALVLSPASDDAQSHSPLVTGAHPGDWQFAPGEGAVWGRP